MLGLSLPLLVLTLLIIFVAALTKATLGFGESLLAIPLLTFIVGIQVAAPFSSLMAGFITILIVYKSWRSIDLWATWQLTLSAAMGVPLGVWGLRTLPEIWLTRGLGILLILISLYYLVKPTLWALDGQGWAYGFGFIAGALGGAYNIASPPIVVYGAMRRWSPEQFRVTLQGCFLPLGFLVMFSQAVSGLWTLQLLQLFIIALPVMMGAFWVGTRLAHRISTEQFTRLVYVALLVLGVALCL